MNKGRRLGVEASNVCLKPNSNSETFNPDILFTTINFVSCGDVQ